MPTEQTQKPSLIHNIINELNGECSPQKLLLPYIEYIKSAVKPYYSFHIILQITIVILLIILIYKTRKL